MAKVKTKVEKYKEIFCKLHLYQVHGADNLIKMLTRYLHGKAEYMASYIELVAERTGVSSTCRITSTNKDIITHVVKAMVHIDEGMLPNDKDIEQAWAMFIDDYRNNKIKL